MRGATQNSLPLLDVLPDARLRDAGVDVRQRVVSGVPVPFSFQVGRWILELCKNDICFLFKIDLKIKLKITNHTLKAHDIAIASDILPCFRF